MDAAALIGSYIGLLVLGLIIMALWVRLFRGDYKDNKLLVVGLNIFALIGVICLMFIPDKNFPNKFSMLLLSISFLSIFLLFLAEEFGIIDATVGSLVETFRNVIIFFENNSVGSTALKVIGGLIFLSGLITSFIYVSKSTTQRNVSKGFSVGIYTSLLLMGLFGFLYVTKQFRENKVGSMLFNNIQNNPNRYWTLFSLISLATAIPLAILSDEPDVTTYKNKMKGCNNKKEKPDGGYSMDTKEEIKICEEEARKSFEKSFPLTEYPLIGLIIFLLLGYGVIGRKGIINFLKKDAFRSLLVVICLMCVISFIIFQVNSEKYYVSKYPRTKTEPAIPDSYYIPISLTFTALATILSLSLFTLSMNYENIDRPDTSNMMANTGWLLKKLFKYFKFTLVMFLMILIIGLSIYFYTGKKTYESGIANLSILMLVMALGTFVYKKLSGTEFIQNSKIFRFLLNLILLIPCLLFFIIEYVYNDLTDTPKIVYAVLLGEILLFGSYILLPIFVKFMMSHYVSKNNDNVYKIKKKELERNIEKLKTYYDEIHSRVDNVINKDDWEAILNNQYYSSKDNLKNYLEKIRDPGIDKTQINKNDVDEETDNEIRGISEKKGYKSKDRYEQVVNFIYYFVVNQLDSDIYLNKVNIQKIKEKETKYQMERDYVDEKIKKGKIRKSQVLVESPIYLDKELKPNNEEGKVIRFQNLEPHMMSEKINDFSYNYGLSMWVNLHNQNKNFRSSYNKFTNLINYSSNPKISYNIRDDILRVEVLVKLPENLCCGEPGSNKSSECVYENTINDRKTLEVVKQWCAENMTKDTLNNNNEQLFTIFEKEGLLKKQKWNNIVINYDLGILDIFVNGNLEGSWNGTLQYMADRPIIIGEKYGISGGICNVVYYPTALTKNQIEFTYSALKSKNPPII
jgi:hypothetical protein